MIESFVPRIKFTAENVCPDSPGRLTRANAAIVAASGTAIALTRTSTPSDQSIAFVNEHSYDAHDGGLLQALSSIFTDSFTGGSLMEKSDGSGMALLALLALRRDKASGLDRTVLVSRWQRHIQKGVVGPVNYTNWTIFWELHERLRLVLPAGLQGQDETHIATLADSIYMSMTTCAASTIRR